MVRAYIDSVTFIVNRRKRERRQAYTIRGEVSAFLRLRLQLRQAHQAKSVMRRSAHLLDLPPLNHLL